MKAWKRSAGHNDMLLDDRYYEGAAVAVMFNPTAQTMEAVIMCSGTKGKVEFEESDDNYIAQTWFPFIFKNPKFTKNRGGCLRWIRLLITKLKKDRQCRKLCLSVFLIKIRRGSALL